MTNTDAVEVLRKALKAAKIGLRDWEVPATRYNALDIINAALAATEVAAIQPLQDAKAEQANFCATCGKRLHAGSIHTCTPPAATVQVEASELPKLPHGYTAKHVEGQGWIINAPTGSKWIAHDDTPAGDLMTALHRAPAITEPATAMQSIADDKGWHDIMDELMIGALNRRTLAKWIDARQPAAPGVGARDGARLDRLEAWRQNSIAKGFDGDTFQLTVDQPIRDQLDSISAAALSGRTEAGEA